MTGGLPRVKVSALIAATALAAPCAAVGSSPVGTSTPVGAADLSHLTWLEGCWASATGEAGTGEFWLPLAGGTLLGVSRTVHDGKTTAHEFMQIRALPDGRVAFIGQPSGQASTAFPAVSISATEVVFANPAHDFPQRITYRLEEEQKLLARIDGPVGGKLRVIDFRFIRTPCDGPTAPADTVRRLP
jgi:hypothetical protein